MDQTAEGETEAEKVKVRELIDKLRAMPQESEAVIPAADYGANPVELVCERTLRDDNFAHWAFGRFVDADGTRDTVVLLGHSEVDMEV